MICSYHKLQHLVRAADPCDYRYRDVGRNPEQEELTVMLKVSQLTLFLYVVNATARGVTGGNPNLINEVADTKSTGLVYQPNGGVMYSLEV